MLDITKIDINDIDEFGGVYTDDGYEALSNKEIEMIRAMSEEKRNSSNENQRKHSNKAKITLQKNDKVRHFKDFSDVRSISKHGKVFFIAGAVVFVSTLARVFVLDRTTNNITNIQPDVQVSQVDTLLENERNIKGPKDLVTSKVVVNPDKSAEITIKKPDISGEIKVETKRLDIANYNASLSQDNLSIMTIEDTPQAEARVDDLQFEKKNIKKYCEVYGVNYDIVYEKIKEMTENFTSSDYLSGTIKGITCKGEQVQTDNKEELLLLAVRIIKFLPQNFGLSSEQINVPLKQVKLGVENATSSEVILDEYHEKMAYYANLFKLDKCIIHGIVQCETGYNSNQFNNDHNPAGLCMDGVYRKFDSDEEGLIELCTELVKYRSMGATTIEEIGQIHNPGPNYIPWVNLTTECTNYAKTVEKQMFPNEANAYTR